MNTPRDLPKTIQQLIFGGEDDGAVPITDYLNADEPAYLLAELIRISKDSRNVRRWEFIYVVRNDALAVHIRDMGPPAAFPQGELIVVGELVESVEWCREQANDMRFQDNMRKLNDVRKVDPEVTVKRWAEWRMSLWEERQNRSHFGPAYHRERNAFVRSGD